MFDKEGFKKYVGTSSADSYASGLTIIERTYELVDIDGEFDRDGCTDLLKKLESAKFEEGLDTTEKSIRQNHYSNLKKIYVF